MSTDEIRAALDAVFDQAIVFHAYANHMRDYDVFIYATAASSMQSQPEHLRYRFTHCVSANISSAVRRDVWARSLDERLTNHRAATEADLDGYVWGVNWQCLYPGATLIEDSDNAAECSRELGISFHEVTIETNAHNLSLIFSDLVVTAVEPVFNPFVVSTSESD